MATNKTRPNSTVLQDVEEINGWITVKKAAEIIGIEVPSLSAKVYEQRFKAVRIAGVILCEKASVEKYAADRAQEKSKVEQQKEWQAAFDRLSPDERAKLLAQLNSK